MEDLRNVAIPRRILLLIGVLIFSAALAYTAYVSGLNETMAKTLFVTLTALGLWVSEAIPAFAVSLAVVAAQFFFLDIERGRASDAAFHTYTQAWSSPVIWLMLGGFILSLAMSVTGLDRTIAMKLLRMTNGRTSLFLALIMATAAGLSMFMSNTATTALLVSIVLPIFAASDEGRSLARITLLGIASGATVGGQGTMIGSSPNAIALGFFARTGVEFDFLRWMRVGLPVVLCVLVPLYFLLLKSERLPKTVNVLLHDDNEPLSQKANRQRTIVMVTFAVTVGLWLASPLLSWSISAIAFIPIVAFTVTGIVKDKDIRQLPWDTLLFVMGGIVLGQAVSDSGLAAKAVEFVPFHELSPAWMLLALAYSTMILSNFLSNTAAAALLMPLGAAISPDQSAAATLVIALAASSALFLPVSTPTNTIVYATGLLTQGHFRKVGLFVGLVAPAIIVGSVLLFGGFGGGL